MPIDPVYEPRDPVEEMATHAIHSSEARVIAGAVAKCVDAVNGMSTHVGRLAGDVGRGTLAANEARSFAREARDEAANSAKLAEQASTDAREAKGVVVALVQRLDARIDAVANDVDAVRTRQASQPALDELGDAAQEFRDAAQEITARLPRPSPAPTVDSITKALDAKRWRFIAEIGKLALAGGLATGVWEVVRRLLGIH